MGSKEVLSQAIALKPEERFMIIEGLLKSLDEPDRKLDEIWAEEAEKRLLPKFCNPGVVKQSGQKSTNSRTQ